MNNNIEIANTDQQINACYPVMRELRPHIKAEDFLKRVRYQQTKGYFLVAMEAIVDEADELETVVAVAGFRIGENLAWGRFLYIDDLVTNTECRSKGYGSRLLEWLNAYASTLDCEQLHLDSGLQRVDAHRFYEREGLPKTSFHFSTAI